MRFIISGYVSLLMQFGPLIGVPIFAYYFSNWWMLFGIAFAYAGISVGYTKIKYLILILLLIACFAYWNSNGFDFHQLITFDFFCFLFGFTGYTLYKLIGFGDNTSRAMITALGNRNARKEIEKEIEAGMEKWRAEKADKENADNSNM